MPETSCWPFYILAIGLVPVSLGLSAHGESWPDPGSLIIALPFSPNSRTAIIPTLSTELPKGISPLI